MSHISSSVPSLANGVSQQPPWVRLTSQVAAQENMLSSLVVGLTRRSGTKSRATVTLPDPLTVDMQPYIHTIKRDDAQQFIVLIYNSTILVYDTDGVQHTVSFPNGTDYLGGSTPYADFAVTSVADYTFIVNKHMLVTTGAAPAAPPLDGYIYIKQGAYGCTYSVTVNGSVVASFATSTTDVTTTQPLNIASQLTTSLIAMRASGWTVDQFASLIRLRAPGGIPFTLSVADGGGNNYSKAYQDKVQSFSDLPPIAFDGAWFEVIGSANNAFDNYYVQYSAADGTWKEVAKPVANYSLTPSTMPHRLVHNVDGTFTFSECVWTNRTAGDTESAPDPSFVGRTINDVFFWKGRLGFLSDDNVVMSRAGKFFSFYPQTVTTLLDSDPIDVSADSTQVALLHNATPFDEGIILWTETQQYELTADSNVPTPKSCALLPTTAFPVDLGAKPVTAGKGVLFPYIRGGYAGVREYLKDRITGVKDALDASIHVPTYMAGNITRMAALRNDNLLFCLCSGDTSGVYVYKYHWEGDTKLQSAWSRWSFAGATVLAVDTLGQKLILLLNRGGLLSLETLEIDIESTEIGLPWRIALDRKVYVTGTFDGTTTTWTLPYAAGGAWVVLGGSFGAQSGSVPPSLSTGVNTVSAPGDWSGGQVAVGLLFTSQVQMSTLFTETPSSSGKGRQSITEGRTQILRMWPLVSETGILYSKVEMPGYAPSVMTHTSHGVNYAYNPSDLPVVTDGRFEISVFAENTAVTVTLYTDTHLPCAIQSVDWDANFTMHSRRV